MTDNVSINAEAGLKGAATDVASFSSLRGPVKVLQSFIHRYPTSIPLIVLLLGLAVFAFGVGPKFFAPFNLSLILQQVTIIGVLAIAQTLIILTAGIDLSVGAIMVLSAVVMGRLAVVLGLPPELSFLAGLLCGTFCGFINGMFVSMLRLPPFIVTLGTCSMFGAMVLYVSRSETIRSQDVAAAAPMLQWLGTRFPIGAGAVLTAGSLLMVVIAICIWYVLTQTAFGRHIYATGDDPEAVRLAGINSKKTLIAVYTIAGFICAVAGWVVIGRIGAVSPLAGANANLDAITAVVIGGTSLFGGRGSIVGSLIGALIVGTFRNGLALWGVEVLWQEFAVGGLIILAVTIDQWIRRISA
ncbi:ABC transporter permease [Rhizobium rhizogenes]|uniref:ABC transporter permease n=1 Tax=Rhizobium rhizogenes TaxID=359 RepID=A0AA92BZP8_RHIRH|nr:ABC transporter permease [Rhizobium rhizogenes]PVE50623.1 ABC transporter permease [Rhizobium rhizogenes]PVE62376.1 ABC transporter permease [Agrobacterium tumefaciens]PVE70559.1 ABC transporter permease [Sphingomonas sp. TPD3009]